MKNLFNLTYGSRLYGTSTPTSDTDAKTVYLPDVESLLLGKKMEIFKDRFDAEGNKLGVNATMPANGVETEFIPFQRFVRDFVQGQTYALEVAYGVLQEQTTDPKVRDLIEEMVLRFRNAEVYSMVGFAMKQTFDYVRRGERLIEARKVMTALSEVRLNAAMKLAFSDRDEDAPLEAAPPTLLSKNNKRTEIRLDTVLDDTTVLDMVAEATGLPIGLSQNNHRSLRTLELNGRQYLETTPLDTVSAALGKMISQYGERSADAADKDVDYKSLSHAIRVYQQAIELLDTGFIKFPRPNAAYLLAVKKGEEDLEEVKELLRDLDDEVKAKMELSALPKRTPELEEAAEVWLLEKLMKMYFPPAPPPTER